jgi:hypothetical protein
MGRSMLRPYKRIVLPGLGEFARMECGSFPPPLRRKQRLQEVVWI